MYLRIVFELYRVPDALLLKRVYSKTKLPGESTDFSMTDILVAKIVYFGFQNRQIPRPIAILRRFEFKMFKNSF